MTLLPQMESTALTRALAGAAREAAVKAPPREFRALHQRANFLNEVAQLPPAEIPEAIRHGRIEPRTFGDGAFRREISNATTGIEVPAASVVTGARGPVCIRLRGELLDVPANLRRALALATEVHLDIDSPGGSASAALRVVKLLRRYRLPVHVEIVGLCCSAAAVVACLGGTRRAIRSDCSIMLHAPAQVVNGGARELRRLANELDGLNRGFIDAFTKRTGQPRATVERWFDGDDHWFDAESAKAVGLVDEIFGGCSHGRSGSDVAGPALYAHPDHD